MMRLWENAGGGRDTKMMQISPRFILAAVMVAAALPSSAGDTADLVLQNGVFYTSTEPFVVRGSMAVESGRIVHLGSIEAAATRIGAKTAVLDLRGRTVTPGFIDAHSHLVGLGRTLRQVNLVGAGTYDEVIARTRAFAENSSPGSWIYGRGWDQNDWPTAEFPHHRKLSEALPDHPVWLTRVDGHAALLNRRALDELAISADLEAPPGGRIVRDASGQPTGVLIDTAMSRARERIGESASTESARAIREAADHCLALGLTTVTDMGVDQSEIDAYRRLADAGELKIRASLFLDGDDEDLLSRWFARGPEAAPAARWQVRGIKLYADGALGSRGAALIEPYGDDPGNLGLLVTGADRLEAVCRRAVASGFQVGVHAIGDRGGLVSLDAMERCFGEPKPGLRFRLEHAQVLRPADIERLAHLGVVASVQPTHATSDMPWAERRVGSRRIAGAYAWRKLSDAGARLALGSDFPVESADPLLGFYAAVTRQDTDGYPDGGWLPGEKLSREEALRGFTIDAAHSLFLDREIGSLEIGKRADLVVFSSDIMTVPAAEIPAIRVDLTLVDGQIVYRREGDVQ